MGAGVALHSEAEPAPRCSACLDVAHTGVAPPRDTHSPLLPDAKGSRNSLSRLRRFSFGDGVPSTEARHGVASKSGWSGSCVGLLLPTRGATDCDHGSANWSCGISSFTPPVERGVGKFAVGVAI